MDSSSTSPLSSDSEGSSKSHINSKAVSYSGRMFHFLPTASNVFAIACAVGIVVGAVFLALTAVHIFGPSGSSGFLMGLSVGGGVTLISILGLIGLGVTSYNQEPEAKILNQPIKKIAIQTAKAFSESKLSEMKLDAYQFNSEMQPKDQKIACLKTLYDIYYEKFNESSTTSWQDKAYIEAADALMKVAYILSVLTFEDIENNEELKENLDEHLKFEKSGIYPINTFYVCGITYLRIKNERNRIKNEGSETAKVLFDTWNTLYNDFCEKVHVYLPGSEYPYTQKDEGQ